MTTIRPLIHRLSKRSLGRISLEISFTILNRLAALRLCEERGLIIECVRKGTTSDGFRLFERVSGGALGGRHDTYRVFLECLFDELALDLGVLFDRMGCKMRLLVRSMRMMRRQAGSGQTTRESVSIQSAGWLRRCLAGRRGMAACRA